MRRLLLLGFFLLNPLTIYTGDTTEITPPSFFLLPAEIIDSYFPQSSMYFIPDDPSYSTIIQRAALYEKRHDFRQASKFYLMAYNKAKGTEKAPYLLFKQSVLLENAQATISGLRDIIELYPSFLLIDAVRYELAIRLYMNEDYDRATEFLQEILEHEESGVMIFSPYVWTFLGIVSSAQGDFDQSIEYIRSSLEVITRVGVFQKEQLSIRNYLELAKAMIELEEFEHLHDLLTRILGTAFLEVHQQEALLLLAKFYELSGMEAHAFWTYSQLSQQFPSSIFSLKAEESADRLSEAGEGTAPDQEIGVFDGSLLTGHYKIGQEEILKPYAEEYFIQLGSFSDEKNAENLARKLIEQGYIVFYVEALVDGKKVFRVRVGAGHTSLEAERLLQELSGLGYQGFIVHER